MEECLEKTGGVLSDSEKADGETKESEWDENKVQVLQLPWTR